MPSDLKCPAPKCGGEMDIHSADPDTGRSLSWQCQSCGRVYTDPEQRGPTAEDVWHKRERTPPDVWSKIAARNLGDGD